MAARAATPGGADGSVQVLMFGLGHEIFAVEACLVREILDPVPTTRVAGARGFVPFVINVRGNVIPLADLRVCFGMRPSPVTPDTRVVVLEVLVEGDPVSVGVVADKVHEVTEISHTAAQPTPRVGMQWRPEFIRFITNWNDEFVIVPDLENIFT